MCYFSSFQTAEVELLLSHEKNKPQNWVEAGMSALAWPNLVEVSWEKAKSFLLSGNGKGFLGSLSQLPG